MDIKFYKSTTVHNFARNILLKITNVDKVLI